MATSCRRSTQCLRDGCPREEIEKKHRTRSGGGRRSTEQRSLVAFNDRENGGGRAWIVRAAVVGDCVRRGKLMSMQCSVAGGGALEQAGAHSVAACRRCRTTMFVPAVDLGVARGDRDGRGPACIALLVEIPRSAHLAVRRSLPYLAPVRDSVAIDSPGSVVASILSGSPTAIQCDRSARGARVMAGARCPSRRARQVLSAAE
jgi:hypothetical protein